MPNPRQYSATLDSCSVDGQAEQSNYTLLQLTVANAAVLLRQSESTQKTTQTERDSTDAVAVLCL
jgi:hypothetical protein